MFAPALEAVQTLEVAMPRGGARNRSGPGIDPGSGRSEVRGIVLTALPSEGFSGEVPDFPLPAPSIKSLAGRERAVWAEAWSTPQAAAWSVQKWRLPVIAEYVRLKALCEVNPNASLIAQLHRYRDQLGLTPAGLKENGWAIAVDEVGPRAAARAQSAAGPTARRLRVAPGDGVS